MEFAEEQQSSHAFKLPDVNKYDNLILKKGLLDDSTNFRMWYKAMGQLDRNVEPGMLKVELHNVEGTTLMIWLFQSAWPVSIKLGGREMKGEAIEVEELEFSYTNYTVHNNLQSL
jgi:phage tail-like protein